MQLDKLLGQRQPQSGALDLFGVIVSDLAELLENLWLVLFCDSNASIGYGNL